MQKRLVLVEYDEWWYGTVQRCLMRWAGGDTQRGVETDRDEMPARSAGPTRIALAIVDPMGGSVWPAA